MTQERADRGALAVPRDSARSPQTSYDANWPATTNSLYPEELHALLEPALEESRRLLNDDSLYACYLAALDAGMAELVLSYPMPML